MLLSDKDRLTFIQYLELTGSTCKQMAIQFSEMPGNVMVELEKREKLKEAACSILIKHLNDVDVNSI